MVIAGTTVGAATNNDGYYTIGRIEPGTYTVVISYVGYRTACKEITLDRGERSRLDFQLDPGEVVGEEVVVTAEREEGWSEYGLRKNFSAYLTKSLLERLCAAAGLQGPDVSPVPK